jgi:hypothetical protein
MKKLLTFFSGLFIFCGMQAQQDSGMPFKKHSPHMALVKTFDGKTTKGWFYQMNDSQVVLLDKGSQYLKMAGHSAGNMNIPTHTFKIEQIRSISMRKRNAVLKGFLFGLGAGIITGAISGLASGDDPVQPYTNNGFTDVFVAVNNAFAMTAGEKALYGAIGLGATGALTGIIIGALTKKKFIIGGSRKRVRDLDGEMRRRLLLP